MREERRGDGDGDFDEEAEMLDQDVGERTGRERDDRTRERGVTGRRAD